MLHSSNFSIDAVRLVYENYLVFRHLANDLEVLNHRFVKHGRFKIMVDFCHLKARCRKGRQRGDRENRNDRYGKFPAKLLTTGLPFLPANIAPSIWFDEESHGTRALVYVYQNQ